MHCTGHIHCAACGGCRVSARDLWTIQLAALVHIVRTRARGPHARRE